MNTPASNNTQPQLKQLSDYENYWPTSMGKVFVGERAVLRGHDLLHDLIDLNWMELHFYSITGRYANKEKLHIMMTAWTGCSYPDPRIWNNRISALAGTSRSTAALAVGASTAVSEATIYGHRANKKCIDSLLRAHTFITNGGSLDHFITQEKTAGRRIYGYGRPIKNADERIAPMMKLIKKYHLENDTFIQLCFALEKHLKQQKNLAMNITGLTAGVAASLGLTPLEYHLFLCPVFTIGFSPCYLDSLEKPAGCLLPLRCDRIQYTGEQKKSWHEHHVLPKNT